LNVPYTRELLESFHREHQRRYGYSYDRRDLELVTLRLRATVKSLPIRWTNPMRRKTDKKVEIAPVILDGKKLLIPIYDRDQLSSATTYHGPAIVTEYSATTVVPRSAKFRVDSPGNLIISL
jgi:N-methylhydantoinase A